MDIKHVDGLQAELDGKAASSHTHTWKETKSWIIPGEIKVPSGDDNFINPIKIRKETGQTVKVVAVDYKINGGTSVSLKLQKNGSDISGFTGLSATTSWAQTDPTDQTLADGDIIAPLVTGVSGTPKNMTINVHLEYTA